MAIAKKLRQYLDDAGVRYDVIEHSPTPSASRTAQVAHVSGERMAKAVVLQGDEGYVVAAVPSTHQLELEALVDMLGQPVSLATEGEIGELFADCEVGAVPSVGDAYGLKILMDDSLSGLPDVYFEAGDHRSLVHVNGGDFASLMANAQRGRFSHHV